MTSRPQSDRQDDGLRPRCPVCNKPLSPGDFCDDLQCPNPIAAQPASFKQVAETFIRAAPPKPPDAMREAIRRLAEIHVGEWLQKDDARLQIVPTAARQDIRDFADAVLKLVSAPVPPHEEIESESMFHDRMSAEAATLRHEPVPPADGTRNCVACNKLWIDGCWGGSLPDFSRCRNLSPSPAVAAEPVAWEYELATVRSVGGTYGAWEGRLSRTRPSVPEGSIRDLRPLYATPPVRGDREAIAMLLDKIAKDKSNVYLSSVCTFAMKENLKQAADIFGMLWLACEIAYLNDEGGSRKETPEDRYQRMRAWIVSEIREANSPPR